MLVSFVQETLLRNSPAVTGKPPPTEWNTGSNYCFITSKKRQLDVIIYSDQNMLSMLWKNNGFFPGKEETLKKVKNVTYGKDSWNYIKLQNWFLLVEGHTGDPGNERCDYLAKYSRRGILLKLIWNIKIWVIH